MQDNLDFLDVITVLSFVLQLNNRNVQADIDRAVDDIHQHLKEQDEKLNILLERQAHDEL